MTREEFLHCQICAHCKEHRCRDMYNVTVSLCDIYKWPSYDPECPDFVESTDDEHAWARRELRLLKEGKL